MAEQAVPGRLITLEGLEGVGKTTNRAFVKALLQDAGIEVIVTREPGGTPMGEQLRELMLHSGLPLLAATELSLVVAARLEHLHRVIEPALAAGHWVLSDRFIDASYAYQGGGRELGADAVTQMHKLLGVHRLPDLTLLLDMSVSDGLRRSRARSEPDRIERESLRFFERARAVYRQRALDDPQRVRMIDASLALSDVQIAIREALGQLLKSTGKPGIFASDAPAPDTRAPDSPAPKTIAPDSPAPDTRAPKTPAPDSPDHE